MRNRGAERLARPWCRLAQFHADGFVVLGAVAPPAQVEGREKQIGGSGGPLEPPGPPLEPALALLTHLHTVYMACSERLPTRLNALAERACFSQVEGLRGRIDDLMMGRVRHPSPMLFQLCPSASAAIGGGVIMSFRSPLLDSISVSPYKNIIGGASK